MLGTRETQIVDAEGHVRTYDFTNGQVYALNEFENLLSGSTDSRENPLIVVYQTMTITVPGGHEIFQFDPASGMALAQSTDFSGNTTSFTHDTAWAVKDFFPWLPLATYYPVTHYTDPTSQTNAKGDTKYFHYNSTWRVMDRVLDEEGRLTLYTINLSNGLRTAEDIYPAGAVGPGQITAAPSLPPVQHTDFAYDNATFPAFMTQKTVKAHAGDPAWATDLVTQYQPNARGQVRSETVDPGGLKLKTTHTYDLNGNKRSTTDPRGYITRFKYDGLNRLYEVEYPSPAAHPHLAVRKTMTYDANSNKTSETDEKGHVKLFVYDELNRLKTTGIDVDGDGQLTRGASSPDLLVTSYGYNAVNSKTSVTDPKGNTTNMTYDDLQRLIKTEQPAITNELFTGKRFTTQYFYDLLDANGQPSNPGGNCYVTSSFKPTRTIDPRGYTTSVAYDALYRESARHAQYDLGTGAKAHTFTAYDKVGNPTRLKETSEDISDPDQLDPAHTNVTLKNYDALNRLTQTTYAWNTSDQAFENVSYTSTGLAWQSVDGKGNTTTKEYDAAGRPVKVAQPLVDDGTGTGTLQSPVTQTVYDANGNVTATINPRNARWDYTFDERNRRVTEQAPAMVDPADGVSKRPLKRTGYDRVGNVTSTTDALDADQPGAHTALTRYDYANRPYRTVAPAVTVMYPHGGVFGVHPRTSKTYDPNGNVQTLTDANGHTTTNTYDALNRLTDTVDAAGDTVHNVYDEAGNRVRVKDGEHTGMSFGYDGLNRNTFVDDSTAHPAGLPPTRHVTDFTYDGLHKTGRLDLLGQQTAYAYDHRNRLAAVTYPGRAADNRTYAYDPNGNLLSVSEPGKGGVADVGYTYDALNRVGTETSGGHTHDYFYDLAGNRTLAQYSVDTTPAGRVLVSVYDALNRLGSLSEGGRVTGYAYDLDDRVVAKTLPNGDQERTGYDALGRAGTLQGVQGTGVALYGYTYAYDAVGNVRRSGETYASLPAQTITMGYDGANRLVEEDTAVTGGATTQVSYGYDHSNNRTSKAVAGGVATTYAFNDRNQLSSWQESGGGHGSFGYDLNGNRFTSTPGSGAASTYVYDFENRLVSVTQASGGGSASAVVYAYVYDYRTRRVQRTEPVSGGTQVVFSGGTSVAEYPIDAASGSTVGTGSTEYIRGSDWGGGVGGILYTVDTAAAPALPKPAGSQPLVAPRPVERLSYDHYNRRGDVVAQTTAAGVVAYQAAYEAWGTRPAEYGTDTHRQRANTKEEDPTGLLNEGMRYRDLAMGVFLTRDPLGMVDGPNEYTYVNQNPWTSFDPEGLMDEFDVIMMQRGQMSSAQRQDFDGGIKQEFKHITPIAAAVGVGALATFATAGVAAPCIAAGIGEGAVATVGTGIIAGGVGGVATQGTSNVLSGQPISKDLKSAALTGAVLNAGAALIGVTAQAYRTGVLAARAAGTAEALASSTAAAGYKEGTVNVMITRDGTSLLNGASQSAGGGPISENVRGLYGTARTTCAEGRTITSAEAQGVNLEGAMSASASVGGHYPLGAPREACPQACASVLESLGIGDAYNPSLMPRIQPVRPVVPVPAKQKDN